MSFFIYLDLFIYLFSLLFPMNFLSIFPKNLKFFPKIEKLSPSVWGE